MTPIETPRLTLLELEPKDARFIHGLLNEPAFLRYIGDRGVRTLADARRYLVNGPMHSYRTHGFGLYLVKLRRTGTRVGICGLVKRDTLADPDLGFAYRERHFAKGYATEAAAAVLRHSSNALPIHRIVAITSPANEGSIHVLEKVGFVYEGLIRLTPDSGEVKLFAFADQGSDPIPGTG